MNLQSEQPRTLMPPSWVLILAFWVVTDYGTPHPIEAFQKSEPVFVGVLRHDGLLVLTAAYDGREWWNSWPFSNADDELVGNLPVPESLKAIPPSWLPPNTQLPDRWLVQLESGATRRILLTRPERPAEAVLSTTVGIRTDFVPTVSDTRYSWNEVGVAIAGPAQLGRFRAVAAAESAQLEQAVRSRLNQLETNEINTRLAEQRRQAPASLASPDRRASRPFTRVNWIRADRADNGDEFFYFTGTKDYGNKPYPDCDVTVDFHAVVVRSGKNSPAVREASAYTTLECLRDNHVELAFTPLATVTFGTQHLWVIRNDTEDGYDYALMDPRSLGGVGQLEMKGLWQYWRGVGR